ncbi:MAG: aspartate kinase [Candidatus Limnocylindrales bacterium]
MSRLIVQKYGGSSLADAERIRHVAGRIARDRREGADLVVVVSAMGDTTDHLTELAAAITDEPDPREMDLLLATGEHMSGTLVTMALHAQGIEAVSLTGPQAGIRTDTAHGRARIANIDPARMRREIERGRVVIVAGFQGSTAESYDTAEITTLGRGGSDTTAVALAARLLADACEIYTDVEGIFTADPRVVPDAQLIPTIGYEEMLELAHQGATVMQTRAVELGWVNDVVIRVRSTFSDHPGTSIQEVSAVELRDKVRAMALDRKVAKVTIVGVPDRPGIARSIFEPMADQGLNVDMIVQNVGHDGSTDMSFTVERSNLARAERLLELLGKELGFREVQTDPNVAKVSIVGEGIHNHPGYAAQMFGALADEGINISMISTSEIRITCIIEEARIDAAAKAIHRTFRLQEPETPEGAAEVGAG